MMKRVFLSAASVPLLLSVVGCTVWHSGGSLGGAESRAVEERLAGRGPLTLSTTNPYLAQNLFLSRLLGESEEVRGFVAHAGVPPIIAIERPLLRGKLVTFFYPSSQERYLLTETNGVFVIEGPTTLSQAERTLLPTTTGGSVALLSPHLPPTPTPFRSPPPTPTTEARVSARDRTHLLALVKKTGQGEAELSPRGDVVHHVTGERETLRDIVIWYTFDQQHLDAVARINRLKPTTALKAGTSVVVPKYLLAHTQRPSKAGIQEVITTLMKE